MIDSLIIFFEEVLERAKFLLIGFLYAVLLVGMAGFLVEVIMLLSYGISTGKLWLILLIIIMPLTIVFGYFSYSERDRL